MRVRLSPALWVVTGFAAAFGCGAEEEAPKPSCANLTCPFDYAAFDGQTPAVSFEADVMPIFRRACGFSVCHGSATKPAASLFLGPRCPSQKDDPTCTTDGPDDAGRQAIIDAILGVASSTAPAMDIVSANDPANSFLMLKMDGCHDSAGLTCTPQPGAKGDDPCGDAMPQTSSSLCDDERDVVRRWIAQGAKND
ncbi:MAG: hypothetical protein KF718_05405 [Polyangiaceae bacterium]|nr:hypothetical protein [Polyangiaceae bacterium]